ncbi:MAG: RnfABCDGE type electron transport complex subunit C [Phycisphaerae bacterium]
MSFLLDLLGPRQAFDGGLFLPDHKSITARLPIETLHVEGPLHVPLTVHRDLETAPVVRTGDRVIAGQRLSHPVGPNGLPVHAPTSGRITAFSRVWTTLDGYLPGAVLEPDGRDEATPRHQGWEDESFIVQLAQRGVMCSRPRTPLHLLIREAIAAQATDLILNGMETEPYLTAELRMLVEMPGRIIDTACELADALGVSRAVLALPFRHRRVVRRLRAEAEGRHIEIAPLPNPYPQCHPIILVKSLLEQEIAPGGTPLDAGAVVLPLSAVAAAADALLDDRPVTHVTMTVAGDAVERGGTYRVAIGTPMRNVAEQVGIAAPVRRAVFGGPLTGLSLGHEDAVVTAETTALLLFANAEPAVPVPCIRCGWCVEDCPAGIDPPRLLDLEARPSCNGLELTRLRGCLDCGLCTYVCPSQLPLAETIRRTRTRFEKMQPSAGATP